MGALPRPHRLQPPHRRRPRLRPRGRGRRQPPAGPRRQDRRLGAAPDAFALAGARPALLRPRLPGGWAVPGPPALAGVRAWLRPPPAPAVAPWGEPPRKKEKGPKPPFLVSLLPEPAGAAVIWRLLRRAS